MSKPRPVFPGTSVFSTRRVHKRQFLLRPERHTNDGILYILAVLTARYRIELHALTVLSNHKHDCVTDPLGNIVEFQRETHALIARYVNCIHGEFESLWSSEPTCRVDCEEPTDLLDKIAYTMANPVSSYLVAHGHSWPGIRMAWPHKAITLKRPKRFFRNASNGGVWPETATLEFHRPPGFDHLSDEALAELVAVKVEEREDAARTTAREQKIRFLGRAVVRRQSRHAFPSSYEARFSIRPALACKSKWARIERLLVNRVWREDYAEALERYRNGERNVLFPFGTYKMKRFYGSPCRGPDFS